MSADAKFPACPLCNSRQSFTKATVAYDDIWKNIASEWGAVISNPTIDAHSPTKFVDMKECDHCHLQYFFPAKSGSEQFYSELTKSVTPYYNKEKWDFRYARHHINQDDTVLDVACGSGHFFDSIGDAAKRLVGIDTNADAIEIGLGCGLDLRKCSIQEFAIDHRGEFNVVTAFQVIEHLDSIFPFVEAAYQCVSPGGLLILSVPNRLRRTRVGFESFDHPPHHISRWDERQFSWLAERLQGKLEEIAKEPMTASQTIVALRRKELQAMVPKNIPFRNVLIKAASRALLGFPLAYAFHAIEMEKRLEMYGMSLMAILRRPI